MARETHDREDLLREATALVERIELRVASEEAPVVIGFRRDGCASVYLGASPAYHFNTRNELRRAFVADELWKAEHGRLVAMTRERSSEGVQMVARELTDLQQVAALGDLRQRLRELQADLRDHDGSQIVGQMPPDADVLARVRAWLAGLADEIAVAASPHAR